MLIDFSRILSGRQIYVTANVDSIFRGFVMENHSLISCHSPAFTVNIMNVILKSKIIHFLFLFLFFLVLFSKKDGKKYLKLTKHYLFTSLNDESGNSPKNPRTKSSLLINRSPCCSFVAYLLNISCNLSVDARFKYDVPCKI